MSYGVDLSRVRDGLRLMWTGRVARLAARQRHPMYALGAIAASLYILGFWFHIPYGGGHVYRMDDEEKVAQEKMRMFYGQLPVFLETHGSLFGEWK